MPNKDFVSPVHSNMSPYGPICVDIPREPCDYCKVVKTSLYILPCRPCDSSNTFVCRNCLTQAWLSSKDGSVRCPICTQDPGFSGVPPISGIVVDSAMVEKAKLLHANPEVGGQLIGVNNLDAVELLGCSFNFVMDQVLSPTAAGDLPTSSWQVMENIRLETQDTNPFFKAFVGYLSIEQGAVARYIVMPVDLKMELRTLLQCHLVAHIVKFYADALFLSGANFLSGEGQAAALDFALENFTPVRKISEFWTDVIDILIALLTLRHSERLLIIEEDDGMNNSGECSRP